MRRVVILGAAGRDFHNFNLCYRDAADCRVLAFTAAQIPWIAGRRYPPELAGPLYPQGIPIVDEAELPRLLATEAVDEVVFSYSDVRHAHVMHLASIALAGGASFRLIGPRQSMLATRLPVVAVVAARTGAGKSTVARHVCAALRARGRRVVAIRHPMPYGDLTPAVERYATLDDVANAPISVEAMEEYAQHVEEGRVVFAGVDYGNVLRAAEAQADILVWDGGNNDMSFLAPSVTVTVIDPLRPGEEDAYHPGEANVRAADIVVVNKADAASAQAVAQCRAAVRRLNPAAAILAMASEIAVDRPQLLPGARVLAVEDGPSVTHGGMVDAVAARAARAAGATLVDPRAAAVGSIAAAFANYPHIGTVLPALGYSSAQRIDLERTIAAIECDAVLLGSPAPLERLIAIRQPLARARFRARDLESPGLAELIAARLGG